MSSVVVERERAPEEGTGDLVVLHRSLAAMCRSGVPLPDAFRTLAADVSRGKLGDAVQALASDVEDGVPLDTAYRRHSRTLPASYAALVQAGLASGDLPGALDAIARHAGRRERAARTVRTALAGPLVTAVIVLALGVVVALIAGPRMAAFSDATGGSAVSALEPVGLLALGLLAGGIIVVTAMTRFRPALDGGARRRSWALRVPVIGRIRLYAGLASALGTLAALVRRDVPLGEALDLVAETADEPRLRGDLVRMAHAAHEGAGVADAVRAAGALPPSQLWLLAASEERGEASEGLDDLADLYAARLERAVARAGTLLGPLAELAIGSAVFLLAYAYLVPLLHHSLKVLTF